MLVGILVVRFYLWSTLSLLADSIAEQTFFFNDFWLWKSKTIDQLIIYENKRLQYLCFSNKEQPQRFSVQPPENWKELEECISTIVSSVLHTLLPWTENWRKDCGTYLNIWSVKPEIKGDYKMKFCDQFDGDKIYACDMIFHLCFSRYYTF